MARLTKTEEIVVGYLRNSRHGHYTVYRYHGTGSQGGKVKGRSREFQAGLSLIRKGVAEQIGEIYRHTDTRSGYSVFTAELTLRLAADRENQQ